MNSIRQLNIGPSSTVQSYNGPTLIAPNGDMLVTLVARGYHYDGHSLAKRLNGIFIYRSHDQGQKWDLPVKPPYIFNQPAWVPLVPRHSFNGKRIYVFYT